MLSRDATNSPESLNTGSGKVSRRSMLQRLSATLAARSLMLCAGSIAPAPQHLAAPLPSFDDPEVPTYFYRWDDEPPFDPKQAGSETLACSTTFFDNDGRIISSESGSDPVGTPHLSVRGDHDRWIGRCL